LLFYTCLRLMELVITGNQ